MCPIGINKVYGQIVTFQAPKLFKESVDNAVRLYSAGSTQTALLADWKEVESAFRKSLKALRISAETPEEVPGMSIKEKKIFVKLFQDFDKFFAQLKSFTQYEDNMLAGYGITEDEYTDYAGQYLNAKEEIKEDTDGQIDDPGVPVVDEDYELMAYSHTKIDYEYIINLIQNIVSPDEELQDVTQEQKQKQMDEVKQYVEELRKDNPKALINQPEVQKGKVNVTLVVKKTSRAFELNFQTDGMVWVPCDRCLDDMEQPVSSTDKLMVKFGHEYAEEGDNLIVIPEEEGEINVAVTMYEFIALRSNRRRVHAPGNIDSKLHKSGRKRTKMMRKMKSLLKVKMHCREVMWELQIYFITIKD